MQRLLDGSGEEYKEKMDELGDKLLELLAQLPQQPLVNEQQQQQQQLGTTSIVEIQERLSGATITVDQDTEGDTENEEQGQLVLAKKPPDKWPRLLYQEDPAVVAAAAAAAAVKFRSNYMPPIGVFWDIENCQVPKGRSAMAVTRVIRDKFFSGYKEAEFIVVCDVQKENKQIVQELNDAQVDLIHVSATCKNAADEKLRQSIRRFADTHGSPAAIILISGDINFAADLSDLRHRKKIHVILLHKENTSEALILCADEHYDFTKLLQPLPSRTPIKVSEPYDLLVSNLPEDKDVVGIKRRLKQLSNNCGGRVIKVCSDAAVVRFCSKESADRAQKRMHGEFVFDSKITVTFSKEKDTDNSGSSNTQGNSIVRESTASESEAVNGSTTNEMYGITSLVTARSLPGTPHYPTTSPVVGNYSGWNGVNRVPQGVYPPPPVFIRPYFPSETRNYTEINRSQSPQVWQMNNSQQQTQLYWDDRYKNRDYAASETTNFRSTKLPPIRGNSFSQQLDWNPPRPPWPVSNNGSAYNQTHKRRSPSPMFTQQNQKANWNGQVQNVNPRRSDRTPSPYDLTTLPGNTQRNDRISPYGQTEAENEEVENFFNPINNRNGVSNGTHTPIELLVSNLDQNIDIKDMRRILCSIFMEHVMVLQVYVISQSDGNFSAIIKVPSLSEAQYAISQLHRRKIGHKRILISYVHTSGPNPQIVRSQIVMLLQEVPGHKLPLFKFREMYESRFMISISISELYKMKDVCIITDDPTGRMVSLSPDHRNTPSPSLNTTLDGQSLELPYCLIHTQKPWSDKGWAEQEWFPLPEVKISLKVLSERVHKLLTTHSGSLTLPSFASCYEAEFNEPLPIDENGVPLEHLISCLSTVELKQSIGSVKHIVWSSNKNHDESHEENKCISPPLANNLALFSRELVDLLRTAPHCQLSFNRFIPAYHHHFGRQCRVADYGFTKLIDLFEAISHNVQVIGDGNNRVVTLSHRAQVRRFTSDLLRILKAQSSKQVLLSEFPTIYSRVIGKPWNAVDYGVCEMDDILGEVSENTIVVTSCNEGNDRMIAIPKREQTPEEIEKTRQFAQEVVELLKHAPQQRMLFNKFVPSYHHHFGHQCRVSDYGFTKLIELFEAIQDVVNIEEVHDERRIFLTDKERIRVLGEQITKLITRFGNPANGQLYVVNVAKFFLQEFGYALRPELFDCKSMLQLMEKLEGCIKVVNTKNGVAITAIDKAYIQHLGLECRKILIDAPDHRMPVNTFQQLYEQFYNKKCHIEKYSHSLEPFVRIYAINNISHIELTALQRFACNAQRVLMRHNGKINLSQFENAYLLVIGSACRAAQYGYPTLYALLRAIPCTVSVKEVRHRKKVVQLNKKLAAVGLLPPTYTSASPLPDTDSSNDSIENESTSTLNVSNTTFGMTADDSAKWEASCNSSRQFPWNEDPVNWEKKATHWALSGTDETQKWRDPEESFNIPMPPMPDPAWPTTPKGKDSGQWRSSIWSTPPRWNFNQDTNTPKVEVKIPPMHLSSPFIKILMEEASSLISPAKNLLPATANPLEPCTRTSPYFDDKHSPVVAPHPSELPLPSLSFTPKKNTSPEENGQSSSLNNTSITVSPVSSQKDANGENSSGDRIGNTTPSKRSFYGKCRLAAQFNQPPFDS